MTNYPGFNWPLFLILLVLLLLIYLILAYFLGWWPFRRPIRFPPEEYYIQDQVILTGPEADVEAAVLRGQERGVSLTRLQRLRFSDLGSGVLNCDDLPHSADPGKGLIIDLYRIEGARPNVARVIEQITRDLEPASQVRAEPNWLAGAPFEGEGSPFEGEGSPFEGEGSSGGGGQEAQPDFFMSQWAFRTIGLDGRPAYIAGDGVRVGIFDTSPYKRVSLDTPTIKPVTLDQVPPLLELNLLHRSPTATLKSGPQRKIDVRNHGLYISGLVHAIAPGSDIRLIRVMEPDNRCDLFTLISGLFDFMVGTLGANAPANGSVISLSLGVRIPPEEARFRLPLSVLGLEYLMIAANCLGIVVIAAAGNNSKDQIPPLPATIPASMPTVIGVAASNPENRRSCYSNVGDIGAPGGDGGSRSRLVEVGDSQAGRSPATDKCAPLTKLCKDENCEFGVVGPILQPPYDDENHVDYIFWVGSSFSTPMVSALAALILQAAGGGLSPAEVAEIMKRWATKTNDPTLGAGVIHIGRAVVETLKEHKSEVYQAEEEQLV